MDVPDELEIDGSSLRGFTDVELAGKVTPINDLKTSYPKF